MILKHYRWFWNDLPDDRPNGHVLSGGIPHPRPDPVSMFIRYLRHRLLFVPSAAICATGLDLAHGV
jgi:hypothetical protein